jgi:hypothetical protein
MENLCETCDHDACIGCNNKSHYKQRNSGPYILMYGVISFLILIGIGLIIFL